MPYNHHDISSYLATPNRQSPVAILLILLKFAKILGRQAWPLLIILFLNPEGLKETWFVSVIIGVAFISAIVSIVSYFKFYFYIEKEELIIEKGLFQKTKLNIPLERIQTVNFHQNVIHQAFNVVGLDLDTAGSKGNEFSISALSRIKAEAIRSYLIAKRQEIGGFDSTEDDIQNPKETEKILLNLETTDLFKIGIGQNHLKMMGLIFGTLYGAYELLSNIMGEKKANLAIYEQFTNNGLDNLILLFITIVPILLFLAFILSMFSTILKYYHLQFIQTLNGFKVISGLLNRQERSANMDKIQIIHWGDNPIKRFFKMHHLRLSQASSTVVSIKQSIVVPGCYAAQLETVKEAYLPNIGRQHFLKHRISRVVIFRRTLYRGIFPAILLATFYGFSNGIVGLWPLLWIPVMYWVSRRYYDKWRYSVSEDVLQITYGIIGTSNALLKWHKVQGIKIRQTMYQRRKNLATIYFYTAAGRLHIPYIELEKAEALQNYVLYKVESSQARWM